ncbi:MAG TPA: GNAT family N-acetyltransferase [Methylomirabilota bacterium]|nr:GNAT family N-acetyltransferase [Methylomirabilota bacterium]
MLALEGTAPHAGASLIQARANFFARTDAYPVSQALVAEREGAVIGVECLALTEVRVGGVSCRAGYSFNNTRVQPGLQRRGLGPALLEAAEQWAQAQGAGYLTGLIKTSNVPSMKMVTALGWETVARFDYLVLELARFDGMAEPRAVQFDLYRDPHLMRLRLAVVQSNHFAPRCLERDLFSPAPEGAFARLVRVLRARGVRQLLVPLPAESAACAMLRPFAADLVDFNFVVKRLGDSPSVPPGPLYFDIRH